ncbi:PKD-like family lipoprotein [Pararcticibacter amylolyticus]|uniref:PKD-like family protein n=1 Tax=Pararcticibacter amylolyticus TaxID=2173175 RepID=A0A2U2PD19_9SPHI|nr:PKD-like family lipoprotein [Pararcticibacter amylolyticus]PWG79204.1 hypothetical protein DDR33_18115 [Pararcticibacter amylolyticus]
MKIYQYTIVFLFVLLGSCSKDLGNYDYTDINELAITGIQSNYTVLRNVDTLRIKPVISATMDGGDQSRYEYLWILTAGKDMTDTISRERDLEYPILLNPVPYSLYYHVLDKQTGVVWRFNSRLTVNTPFSRGLLLMGEDEEGYAEAEMLSMLNDTIQMKHLLSESGLPRLREPVSFLHTGGISDSYNKLWVLTGSGSYYLNRITMKTKTDSSMKRLLFISDQISPETLHPVVIAPQIRTAAGATGNSYNRAILTKGGDIFASQMLITGGDYYNNPVNRVATAQEERLAAAPYLLYAIGNMTSVIWYDTKNQRFLNYSSFGLATNSAVLSDAAGSAFPWNQAGTGRTLVYAENTRNTDGGSTNGNSFAIMKDAANVHYIYKFYANGGSPVKRASYTIKPIADDFANADFYAFSSNRTVVFYSVHNKLYAYDYNPGNEKIYSLAETGADEITMLKFDTQIDYLTNSLYIATYNPATKGTLRRFIVGSNPDFVNLLPAENSTWQGLIKVKDINWRAVN